MWKPTLQQRREKFLREHPSFLEVYDPNETARRYRSRRENMVKLKARRAVFVEIRAGRMKAEPCKMCGVNKTEAHHKDYSKPLAVVWLCKKHHEELHRSEA